jgi:hypothetical protein
MPRKLTQARLVLIALLVATPALLAPGRASGGGFTPATFDAWIRMRTGGDGRPVYWYASGRVMNERTGELLSLMEGVDTSTVLRDPARPGTWVQLSRKIFISLDPRTGELLKGADGRPRPPIAYPFQVKTYRLEGDEIVYEVESHDGARTFAEPPKRNYTVRQLGSVTHYNYAMFIDRIRPDGTRSQRFEVNDFFLRDGKGLSDEERYQYTWVGTGPGPIVSSALSWRYGSFDAMPGARLKEYIRTRAPLWLAPPKDLAEVEALRRQQPYAIAQ